MTTPSIRFTITDRGKNKALNASKNGLQLQLAKFVYGTGKQEASASTRFLRKKVGEADIISGDVEEQSHTLRFSVTLYANISTYINEIGLLDSDGELFAIASSNTSTILFELHPNIAFTASFGLSLDEFERDQITVVTDPDGALSVTLMQKHLAHSNPHPQYVRKGLFDYFTKTTIQTLKTEIGFNRQLIEAHAKDTNAHSINAMFEYLKKVIRYNENLFVKDKIYQDQRIKKNNSDIKNILNEINEIEKRVMQTANNTLNERLKVLDGVSEYLSPSFIVHFTGVGNQYTEHEFEPGYESELMEKGRTFGFSHVVSERSVSVGSNVLPSVWVFPYIDHINTQGLNKTPKIVDIQGIRIYGEKYYSKVFIESLSIKMPSFVKESSQVSIEFPHEGAVIHIDEGEYGGNGRVEKRFNYNINVENGLLKITGLMGDKIINGGNEITSPTPTCEMRIILRP